MQHNRDKLACLSMPFTSAIFPVQATAYRNGTPLHVGSKLWPKRVEVADIVKNTLAYYSTQSFLAARGFKV